MAEVLKVLGQAKPPAGIVTTIYTVPAGRGVVCSCIAVCNTGGAADSFDVRIRINNEALADKQLIFSGHRIERNDTIATVIGITLGQGDVVAVACGNGDCTFNLFGTETF